GRCPASDSVFAAKAGDAKEFRARLHRCVVVANRRRVANDLHQRPESDPATVRQTASLQHTGIPLGGVNEFFDEARLADTRLGDDRDKAAGALSSARRDLIGEDGEFPRASHQWAVVPSLDTFRLSCRDEPVGRYALCFPLQLEGLDGLDLDCVPNEAVRRLAYEHLGRRRSLFEASGGVDRVTGYESLPGRDVAGDDLTRVDACAVADRDSPAPLELFVQRRETLAHLDGGSDGAERVVLVDAGKAEDGHDRVADVLLDRSAVPLECPAHLIEVARHDLAYRLRVELLRHRRRSLDIREDDRHGLSYFLWRKRRGERRPAKAAETTLLRVFLAAVRTDDHAV